MAEPDSRLILPGSLDFEETLALVLPYDWQDVASANSGDYGFVVDSESGMLRVENSKGIQEYVEGGEYDERLLQIDDLD